MHGAPGRHDTSLWFYTDQADAIYGRLKARLLSAATSELARTPGPAPPVVFSQDMKDMFYGAGRFSIRDPNGYELYFIAERPR